MNDTPSTEATPCTEHEVEAVAEANATGKQPVVFVHGLWLLPSSWDRWREVFEDAGYATLAPGWPGDPDTVEEAKEHPKVFAPQIDRPDRRPLRRLPTRPSSARSETRA